MMASNIGKPILPVNGFPITGRNSHADKISDMRYGERLRAARKHAGLSQAQLAEAVGITQATISQIETSASDGGSVHTVRFARVCGVSPDWLDDEVGDMIPMTYTTSDPKIIAVARVMESLPEYGKDAATKDVAEVAELIDRARHGGNGTDG